MSPKEKIEAAIKETEEKTNFEILAEIKAALNSIYGEDRNQITKVTYESLMKRSAEYSISESSLLERIGAHSGNYYRKLNELLPECMSYQIIIHFPEVVIKNDIPTQHTIKDIFVKVYLRPDGTIAPFIQGMRTSSTISEIRSGYVHSHLPRSDYRHIRFNTFCLGVGEINQVLALLSTKFTSANFMMLLMHIKNYLEWESREGNPYIYMSDIPRRNITGFAVSDYEIDNIIPQVMKGVEKKLSVEEAFRIFEFEVTDKKIEVKPTLEAGRWLSEVIRNMPTISFLEIRPSLSQSDFLSMRDSDGNYHPLFKESSSIPGHDKGVILNFKGKDLKFKVIENIQKEENETHANPKITKEICKKLSRILTKEAICAPGVDPDSSPDHNTGASESDQISLQGSMDRGMVGNALL